MTIAHLSTFPPLKCGIAFYTADLIQALPRLDHQKYALHYGQGIAPDASCHADVADHRSLRALAQAVDASNCDLISLQHEFGIWGGRHGEHLLDFLDVTNKPVVTTLHTTFKRGARPALHYVLLRRLIDQSITTIVLSRHSRETLCTALDISENRIEVIPHGVPEMALRPLTPPEGRGPWRFCTIGFFRPNKGMEETLHALALLKQQAIPFHFIIAGSAQPQFAGQQGYFRELQQLITDLGLSDCVHIRRAFLSREAQIALIRDSHAGIFSYQDPDQSSSGAVPLVLASGRPVVCTPFEYAHAKRQELGDGVVLAPGFDAAALGQAVLEFTRLRSRYQQVTAALHAETRQWSWPSVGRTYEGLFQDATSGINGLAPPAPLLPH